MPPLFPERHRVDVRDLCRPSPLHGEAVSESDRENSILSHWGTVCRLPMQAAKPPACRAAERDWTPSARRVTITTLIQARIPSIASSHIGSRHALSRAVLEAEMPRI